MKTFVDVDQNVATVETSVRVGLH